MAEPTLPGLERRILNWLKPQLKGLNEAGTEFVIGTAPGVVRPDNQDRAVSGTIRFAGRGASIDFAALCDGMGGMVDGGRCAEVAMSAFVASLADFSRDRPPAAALHDATSHANHRVFDEFRGRGGCTLSAIVIHEDHGFVCNVGDSRIYVLTEESGGLRQITRDDTVRGQLDALGVRPVDSVPDHERLVQFVGMGPDLQPQSARLHFGRPGRLVLLSDGAYRPALPVLDALARNSPTPRIFADRLLRLADWLGGRDNATVLCRDFSATRTLPGIGDSDDALLSLWGPSKQLDVLMPAPFFPRPEFRPLQVGEPRANVSLARDSKGERTSRPKNKRHGRKVSTSKARNPIQVLPIKPVAQLELGAAPESEDDAGFDVPEKPKKE